MLTYLSPSKIKPFRFVFTVILLLTTFTISTKSFAVYGEKETCCCDGLFEQDSLLGGDMGRHPPGCCIALNDCWQNYECCPASSATDAEAGTAVSDDSSGCGSACCCCLAAGAGGIGLAAMWKLIKTRKAATTRVVLSFVLLYHMA